MAGNRSTIAQLVAIFALPGLVAVRHGRLVNDQTKPAAGYTDPVYTLAEASRLTGLSVDALRQRIKRGRLQTVPGNDGLVRVRLTMAELEATRPVETRQPDQPEAGQADDKDQTIKALQDDATSLREALSRERERADQAEERATTATALAEDRAAQLRQIEGTLRTTSEKLARAEGVLEGLRMAAEATWWRRLRGIFRS